MQSHEFLVMNPSVIIGSYKIKVKTMNQKERVKMKRVLKRCRGMLVVLAMIMVTMLTPDATAKAAKTSKTPSLVKSSAKVLTGKKYNFNLKNKVHGSTYKWSVKDSSVAEVNVKNGIVTGLKKGTSEVYCEITMPDKTIYKLTATINVMKPAVAVDITNKVSALKVGGTCELSAEVTPGSSNDMVTWTSSDETIATVSSTGEVTALKEGTVTITATTLSGKSDSVTIVIGDEVTDPKTDDKEDAEKKDDTKDTEEPKPTEVPKATYLYDDNFDTSTGAFAGRGSASVAVSKEAGCDGKAGYLQVTGRTSTWNGTYMDITNMVEKGKSYTVTGWVRYTTGAATEQFKISQQRTMGGADTYPQVTDATDIKKGEWVCLSGTMEIDPATEKALLYFEVPSSNIDFDVDHVTIELMK